MKWTDKQKEAIETRNKNILVSAAAGSGKTAVLVERIIRLVIEEKVNIDELLVVTFTKSAASEMKAKIIKAIKKKMAEDPENRGFLKKQLENMYKCSISTFHAFAMDIIKKYFYVIDVNPNLAVADETQTAIMKRDAIEEVFTREFESKNADFLEFLNRYSSYKSEEKVKTSILSLYERIMALPDPFKWLSDNIEPLKDVETFFESSNYKKIQEVLIGEAEKRLEKALSYKDIIISQCEEACISKIQAKNQEDRDFVDKGYQCLLENPKKDPLSAYEILGQFKANVLRSTKDEKESYELIKDYVTDLNKLFKDEVKEAVICLSFVNSHQSYEQLCSTYNSLKTLEDLLKKFHMEYSMRKIDKKIMDFNDIEHFTIEILKNDQVADECRNKYKHIFIDEYQDSNYLQEAIIGSIKRDNNLFMVGDIKQSIYKFRLAEPDIFKEKYSRFSSPDEEKSVKIDLNQNFRSKIRIIDAINKAFANTMDGYDDDASLKLGTASKEGFDFSTEFIVVEKEFLEDGSQVDEMIAELSTAEAEAYAVVDSIKKILGTEFYDSKADMVRPLEYKDIVIIMRSIKSWGEPFREILENNGIPVYLDSTSGYFETLEVALVIDLLKAIDNINEDISLIGVLKSCVFDFNTKELIKIRLINRKIPFNKALKEYAKNGTDENLKEKSNNALNSLDKWRRESRYMPLEQFVWKLIKESGLYLYAASLPHGKQRQLNLRTLVDKTESYSKYGHNSLYGLLNYFENMKKSVETGQSRFVSEDDNAVEITTIHKSKGLEYPVVYIPGMAKSLRSERKDDLNSSHKDLGVGISMVDVDTGEKKETVLQKAMNIVKTREYIEEEIRILYVAMTRAKDRLIMTGSVNDYLEYKEKVDFVKLNGKCYMDYVYPYVSLPECRVIGISKDVAGKYMEAGNSDTTAGRTLRLEKLIKRADQVEYGRIKEIIEYEYPYERETGIKSKYSVSEINSSKKKYKTVLKPASFQEKGVKDKEITGALLGNVYHCIMEHISFEEAASQGREYIEQFVDELVKREFITEEEALAIDISKIEGFFTADIGKRAALNRAKKEKTFTMSYVKDGCETLIQGIIDCYFEEDNGIVLIDYKSNKYTDDIETLYKDQIELYAKALEEGLGKPVKERWLYLFEKGEGVQL